MSWFLALILCAALIGVLLREFWLFICLFAVGQSAHSKGRRPVARRLFELLLGKPSLFGEKWKVDIRFRLAWLLMEQHEPALAAEHCRTILKSRLKPLTEVNVLDRYAECLLSLGDEAGAQEARAKAAQILVGHDINPMVLIMQARTMAKQTRFAEACGLYERALALLPASNQTVRVNAMVRLALASFEAGLPGEAVRWGEAAIGQGAEGLNRFLAHKTAGIGYGSQGLLEEAEKHWQEAKTQAEKLGSTEQTAGCVLYLSTIQMKRGRLAEAYAAAQEAMDMSGKMRRRALLAQVDVLRAWGRCAEARPLMQQALSILEAPIAGSEKRMKALVWLMIVWNECEAGDVKEAAAAMHQAMPALEKDAKLRLYCLASDALIRAMQGEKASADALIVETEAGLGQFSEDRSTQSVCYSRFARAKMLCGDFAQARDWWLRYLETKPDPVWEPNGWHYLGECYLSLGEEQEGRYAFQRAVDVGVDTYTARLAAGRLAELREAGQIQRFSTT